MQLSVFVSLVCFFVAGVLATPPACLLACVAQVAKESSCNSLADVSCLCEKEGDKISQCIESICPNGNGPAALSAFEGTCKDFNAAVVSPSVSASSTSKTTTASSTQATSTSSTSTSTSTSTSVAPTTTSTSSKATTESSTSIKSTTLATSSSSVVISSSSSSSKPAVIATESNNAAQGAKLAGSALMAAIAALII